jgi:hypothetical protein
MEFHKELATHLKKLNRSIRRLVAQSREFEDLRKLLKSHKVELAVYVVPLVSGKPQEDLKFELTDDDRNFLKQAGLKFSEE